MTHHYRRAAANILVVDDNPDNLSLLAGLLTEQGYVVRLVADGSLALEAARVSIPDLILLDIIMPAPDGYEVCTQLKADRVTRDIPVIFISTKDETLDKVKAFSVGGVDYITKPFYAEEILARIENQLKIWRLQKQLAIQNAQLQEEILERITTEATLRQQEQQFRALVENSPDSIMRLDRQFRYLYVNPIVEQKTNIPAADFLGKTNRELGLPESLVSLWETTMQKALDTGEEQSIDYEIYANGSITSNYSRIVPEIASDGTVNSVLVVVRDITNRKQIEEALQESVEREKAIAKVIQKMHETLEIETIFNATTEELRQVLKCDRVVIYRFNPDWSGGFISESVASDSQSFLQSANNDDERRENYVDHENCAVKSLLRFPAKVVDTYLQKNQGGLYTSSDNCLVSEDIYQSGFPACYINLLQEFQARAYIIVPILCGSKLWGLLASYESSGPRQWRKAEINIAMQIGIQLGIALQQAELLAQTQKQSEALQKAVIAADNANRAKSEFIAAMSHELRTPLNSILGFSQLMSRNPSLDREQQENLEIINSSGEHLLQLINNILEMSKIESGQTELNRDCFDLIYLILTLEEMLALKAKSKGLELSFEIAPDLPQYVETDAVKLRQVLINILGNAIKFTQKGRIILRVKPGEFENSRNTENLALNSSFLPLSTPHHTKFQRLLFEIEDTGPGIAAAEINQLFEAFRQTETGRKSEQGSGLGLPISRKFVQLMKGDITVSSQLGKGTIFRFDIQVTLAEATDIPTTQRKRKVIGLAPDQPKYRILVVEDRWENRLLLVMLLTSIGFEVVEAENGQQAIELWETWQPHLIWMDMRMPVMDGYEASKYIKAHPKGKTTAILALTASAFEEDRSLVLSAGCDDFVSKPFQDEIILEKIAQYLGVSYIYQEESEVLFSGQRGSTNRTVLTGESLTIMPLQWLARLHQAAIELDELTIFSLIEQISVEYSFIANNLIDLVDNFRFDLIIDLTEKARQSDKKY